MVQGLVCGEVVEAQDQDGAVFEGSKSLMS